MDAQSGEVLYSKRLGQRAGATMAALASASKQATALELVAWLDAHKVGWAPTPAGGRDAEDLRAGAMRSAISSLRRALEDLPVGLEAFGPGVDRFAVDRTDVNDKWP